jgi:hypothetical protein
MKLGAFRREIRNFCSHFVEHEAMAAKGSYKTSIFLHTPS